MRDEKQLVSFPIFPDEKFLFLLPSYGPSEEVLVNHSKIKTDITLTAGTKQALQFSGIFGIYIKNKSGSVREFELITGSSGSVFSKVLKTTFSLHPAGKRFVPLVKPIRAVVGISNGLTNVTIAQNSGASLNLLPKIISSAPTSSFSVGKNDGIFQIQTLNVSSDVEIEIDVVASYDRFLDEVNFCSY